MVNSASGSAPAGGLPPTPPTTLMKILIYGINFAPELTGIGKYTGEMVEWLVSQGHDVRVVTAPPYYPAWAVKDGYANAWRRETWRGADVWRCPLYVPADPSGKKRVLHLLSFALSSLPVMLRQVAWRPDAVWLAAPAFSCAPGAWITGKLANAATWIHIQDFEVDVAFDTGLLKGDRLKAAVLGFERWLLQRFDVVSTISQRMMDKVAEKRVERQKRAFFPNWVDTETIRPQPKDAVDALRAELGIAADATVVMFSGTLGAKQGLGILPEVARQLAVSCPKLLLLVCGDGVMKPKLEAAATGLHNLKLLPLQPADRFVTMLSVADIHLLPQEPGVADLVMPSKLGAMLASGRPVLATADTGTELHSVVTQCGIVTQPGDATAMAEGLRSLASDQSRRIALGQHARKFAEANLSKSSVLGMFAARLALQTGQQHPAATHLAVREDRSAQR